MMRSWLRFGAVGAVVFGAVGGACTSFGAPGDDDSDAQVATDAGTAGETTTVPPRGDDASTVTDGAPVADAGVDAEPCRTPSGKVDATYALAPLSVMNAVASYEPSTHTFYVAGTETCDASGFARIGLYEVKGAASKRIACLGEQLEVAAAIDADPGGIALATHYPSAGLRAARLHRLASTGGVRAAAVDTRASGARSVLPTGVARLGADDAWSFYSASSSALATPVEGTMRLEGVSTTSLGESIVVAMKVLRTTSGARIATVEAYQGADAGAEKVVLADWVYAKGSSALVRDPNRAPVALAPNAPTASFLYGQGSVAVTAERASAGFTAEARSFAASRSTNAATFTVGPVGTSSPIAAVAIACDTSLLVGYAVGQDGYLARFATPLTDPGPDPTFAPKFARPPAQIFPGADGRTYVFLSGPDARLVRLEK